MKVKLTLSIEKELVERAKAHARQSGKSVSQIVADYFEAVVREKPIDFSKLPPITRSLSGVLKDKAVREDYYEYLEGKYL